MNIFYKILIMAVLILGLFTATYFIGVNKGKSSVEYTTQTIFKYDTITKVIKEPYKVLKDTTIYVDIPGKVDTVEVIKEYYSKHYIEREFKDSNIVITLKDSLYKNDIYSGIMEYKWLQPTQITTNTSITNNYYKYISVGLGTSMLKSFNVDLIYHTRRFYYKVGYDPLLKQTTVGVGTTLFKFK